ncbi:CDP-diacylglycerol--glycerol-3-phosphate 3-phosphatidyltransferase [Chromobacterium haemolyticum]|uniref:CDP-diacylglycerol--glycerol-3-phosphate 3-phosphatidyltransferase n=1 Tax=Chromobacterium haemolyticum TaxID=394935 RepID=UPI0029557764|nr:CDP-diacylglycerol--glycerol-3-phosphate 3-phosphatidyltransferase [Chromobacterium haemolyticum]WON83249.1 CDP-diacylglycerol--glycerol-3-phosphate 3-phosphatidyltransferase [Chromobacterium haemolyticum]
MPFNLPIFLTWLRVALIPICVAVFFLPDSVLLLQSRNQVGAAIFALAAITDWLDGYLARKLGQTSAFGAFLDPVADKLIVAAALILLVQMGRTEGWMAMIIIGREIAISALREWMAEMGTRKSVAVAYIGKLKTTAQMVAILLLLYAGPLLPGVSTLILGNAFMVLAVILTLWSMVYYLRMAAKEFSGKKLMFEVLTVPDKSL